MAWNRTSRRAERTRRPPSLEPLEDRLLLATSPPLASSSLAPIPAQTVASAPRVTPFDALIGAAAVRASYGVDGTGLAAAVIDTGVNYHHEAFGDGFGPGFPVKAGHDFGDNDPDPDATSWQHGTAVAGLLASHDPDHPGVAPGAGIVALRVFGNDNRGSFDRIANALQWVVDHHDQHGITVVNLSISDGNNYAPPFLPDSAVDNRITALVRRLEGLDIPVVTATGNSFQGVQGAGFTAIIAETISVTGSDAADHFVANAQRLGGALGGDHATDLLAPAAGLTAPAEGNHFTKVEGTSFAAPQVSGAVLLLQQIYQSRFGRRPRVADLVGWLKAGADPVFDPVTKITIGRLNIAKAAALIPSAPPPRAATPAPPPSPPAPKPVTPPAPRPVPPPAPRSETASKPAAPPVSKPAAPPPPDQPPASQPDTAPASPPAAPSASQPDAPPPSAPTIGTPPAETTTPVAPLPSPPSPPPASPAPETPAATPPHATDAIDDRPANGSVPADHAEDLTDQVSALFAAALEALAGEREVTASVSTLSNGQGALDFTFAEGGSGPRPGRVRVWNAARVRSALGPIRPAGTLTATPGHPARVRPLQGAGAPQGPQRLALARTLEGRRSGRRGREADRVVTGL